MKPNFAKLSNEKLVVRLRLARGDLQRAKTPRQRALYGEAIAMLRSVLARRGVEVV